jgi:hypothetical protein
VFGSFAALMVVFVWPTLDKSLTIAALALCALMIATPTDYRGAVLTFVAGAGLGYFLELWGTTRLCWTYYTLETPPVFAVMAHGMAAVAFWRVGLLLNSLASRWVARRRTSDDRNLMTKDEGRRTKDEGLAAEEGLAGRRPNPLAPFPEREGGA